MGGWPQGVWKRRGGHLTEGEGKQMVPRQVGGRAEGRNLGPFPKACDLPSVSRSKGLLPSPHQRAEGGSCLARAVCGEAGVCWCLKVMRELTQGTESHQPGQAAPRVGRTRWEPGFGAVHTGMCVQRDVTGMAPACVWKWELVCGCGLKQGLGCPVPCPGAGPFLCWAGEWDGAELGHSSTWGAFPHLSAPLPRAWPGL